MNSRRLIWAVAWCIGPGVVFGPINCAITMAVEASVRHGADRWAAAFWASFAGAIAAGAALGVTQWILWGRKNNGPLLVLASAAAWGMSCAGLAVLEWALTPTFTADQQSWFSSPRIDYLVGWTDFLGLLLGLMQGFCLRLRRWRFLGWVVANVLGYMFADAASVILAREAQFIFEARLSMMPGLGLDALVSLTLGASLGSGVGLATCPLAYVYAHRQGSPISTSDGGE